MSDQLRGDGHLDDGVLMEWVDGVLGADDQDAVDRHLRECAVCAGEAQALQRASRGVSRALGDVTPDRPLPAFPRAAAVQAGTHRAADGSKVPRLFDQTRVAHFGRRRRHVAALAVLVASLALAAPPVRALVRDLVHSAWRGLTGGTADSATVGETAPGRASAALQPVVEVDAGSALTLEFQGRRATGMLTVQLHDRANVALLSTDPRAAVTVLPQTLRVHHDSAGADYRLLVPAGLPRITVRVDGVVRAQTSSDALRTQGILSLRLD